MKANQDGRVYYVKEITAMMKRLGFEQLKSVYYFIKGIID
jgi:hypothetical protein